MHAAESGIDASARRPRINLEQRHGVRPRKGKRRRLSYTHKQYILSAFECTRTLVLVCMRAEEQRLMRSVEKAGATKTADNWPACGGLPNYSCSKETMTTTTLRTTSEALRYSDTLRGLPGGRAGSLFRSVATMERVEGPTGK